MSKPALKPDERKLEDLLEELDYAAKTDMRLTFDGESCKRIAEIIWQLKGALGYPVPGDIPQGQFKCGLCDARANDE